MSWFSHWIAKQAGKQWREALEKALLGAANYINGLRPDQVDAAKERLCEYVQDQRKVPGEIRRIACREINAASAKSVAGLLIKLEALL